MQSWNPSEINLPELYEALLPGKMLNEIIAQHEGKDAVGSPGPGSGCLSIYRLPLPGPLASSSSEAWAWEAETWPALFSQPPPHSPLTPCQTQQGK